MDNINDIYSREVAATEYSVNDTLMQIVSNLNDSIADCDLLDAIEGDKYILWGNKPGTLLCGNISVECAGDSLRAVQKTDEEIAMLMSKGIAVIVDVSHLCVTSVVRAVSRFVNTAQECNGSLRIVIDVDHPQLVNVLKLADAKEKISVKVNDTFMQALVDGAAYEYGDKTIDAMVLWSVISRCGIIFKPEQVNCNGGVVTIGINEASHVSAGTSGRSVDMELLKKNVSTAMRLADGIIGYNQEYIDAIISRLNTVASQDDNTQELKFWFKVKESLQKSRKCAINVCNENETLKDLGYYLRTEEADALQTNILDEITEYISSQMVELDNGTEYFLKNKDVLEWPLSRSTRSEETLQACIKAWQAGCAEMQVIYEKGRKQEKVDVSDGEHVLKRPQELEADVVRFQNKKEKWIAFIGLVDGRPYEIFTGIADDEEGIFCPKSVNSGKIIKAIDENGVKRYDFQFINKRGFKTTIEGLSEKFNPEFWNYAKLISGVLRYGMPIEQVVKLVSSLELDVPSINTWKSGVLKALKKYLPFSSED